MKKLEPLCTAGNVKWYSNYGKQYGNYSKENYSMMCSRGQVVKATD